MAERILSFYVGFSFTDRFWTLSESDRKHARKLIATESKDLAEAVHLYSVFPARVDMDFFIWTANEGDTPESAEKAIVQFNRVTEHWRGFVHPAQTLWGFTRPSQYSRGKSEQDMDPFEGPRASYLVVYPFSKTKEWYLMSADARQGMMNEHIKLGKQYFDIKQLLLYSFGLQDQEFVVSYEVQELPRFSELVYALRNTEARRYTLLDTPIITGVHRTEEEFVG